MRMGKTGGILRERRSVRMRSVRMIFAAICAAFCALSGFAAFGAAQEESAQAAPKASGNIRVAVIDIDGEINRGMRRYVVTELERAQQDGADAIVLAIDTPGGLVAEALQLREALEQVNVPVVAFVSGDAISAGVLIALSADRIVMAPGTNIGSAETIPNDEKTLSYWTGQLRSAAELHGRNAELYAAMADKRIAIPGVTSEGMLLNLTAQRASELGAIDGIAKDAKAAAALGLGKREDEVTLDKRPASLPVRFSQFITGSLVSSILFSIALFALIIELFTPGFGLFGMLSILCFGLYFGGGLLAGYSQWWSVLLFAVGVGLLLAEMAAPGFGLLGIGGILFVALALFFNARDVRHFLSSLALAVVTCSVAVPVMVHLGKKIGWMNKLVLSDTLDSAQGFVSHAQEESMEGVEGVALTALRPAGIVRIGDRRVDAVSTGDFIPKDASVRVVRQEGGRVLVERVESEKGCPAEKCT